MLNGSRYRMQGITGNVPEERHARSRRGGKAVRGKSGMALLCIVTGIVCCAMPVAAAVFTIGPGDSIQQAVDGFAKVPPGNN